MPDNQPALTNVACLLACSLDIIFAEQGWLQNVPLGNLRLVLVHYVEQWTSTLQNYPHVIMTGFILHNFCEMRGESIGGEVVESLMKCDQEFQPPTVGSYRAANNEIDGEKNKANICKKHT